MKKILLALLALLLCFSCTGCTLFALTMLEKGEAVIEKEPIDGGGDLTDIGGIDADENEGEALPDGMYGMGDEMVFDGLTFEALAFKQLGTVEGVFQPEEGNVFIAVKFAVKNTSDEDTTISSLTMMSSTVDGETVTESLTGVMNFDAKMISGDLGAGDELVGWYCMEVSRDWQSFEIEIRPNLFSTEKATFVYER